MALRMALLCWCCLVLALCGSVCAFNLEWRYPMVAQGPSAEGPNPEAYFGYTVALLAEAGASWLYTGAPRANSTLMSYTSVNEPGQLFRCDLLAPRGDACQPMVLESSGNVPENPDDSCPSHYAYCDKKDGAWIGGTLAVSPPVSSSSSSSSSTKKRKVATCGWRWVNQQYKKYYLMNGVCYWMWSDASFTSEANKMVPFFSREDQSFRLKAGDDPETKLFYYAYGQAGFSAQFSGDGKELLLGAPGVLQWTGTVIRYRDASSDVPGGDNKRRRRRASDDDEDPLSELWAPNPYFTQELHQADYVGYSVASGRIISKRSTSYVSGAPRAAELRGKVLVMSFSGEDKGEPHDTQLMVRAQRQGSQVGEGFGSAVAVLDVDADGLDDVLVGAPLHSLRDGDGGGSTEGGGDGGGAPRGDEGKVYVYLSKGDGRLQEASPLLGSKRPGARFGTALAGVGDVNGDGVQDFVVGAPYEDDGAGAIYLYHGGAEGLQISSAQRVGASEVWPSLRGFGTSVGGGDDIDGNGYPDVVAGAYDSGHAVVLRTKPVAAVEASLEASHQRLLINATSFNLSVCMAFHGKNLPETLVVQAKLKLDLLLHSRVFVVIAGKDISEHTYEQTLRRKERSCNAFVVHIRPGTSDVVRPVVVQLTYQLHQSAAPPAKSEPVWLRERKPDDDGFCKDCPVMEQSHKDGVRLTIPFATNCGDDDVCEADLSVQGKFNGASVDHPLVIGSRQSLTLSVTVSNAGENAFLTRVTVSVSPPLSFRRQPSQCQIESKDQQQAMATWKAFTCDVSNPLEQGKTEKLQLELDVSELPSGLSESMVNVFATTASVEKPDKLFDNNVTLPLPLQTSIDITIAAGKPRDVNLPAAPESDDKDAPKSDKKVTVSYQYEVHNAQPSPVELLEMEFLLPVEVKDQTKDKDKDQVFGRVLMPVASLDGQTLSCSGDFATETSDVTGSGGDLADGEGKKRRRKRDVDGDWLPSVLKGVSLNRTVFLNCSSGEVHCLKVLCRGGPLRKESRATVSFRLQLDAQVIRPLLGKETDLLVLASVGYCRVLQPAGTWPSGGGGRPDSAIAWARVLAAPQSSLAPWVVWVAVGAGLLALLLVVLALTKAGFFKRQQLERLQRMRDVHQTEEEFGLVDDASTDVASANANA